MKLGKTDAIQNYFDESTKSVCCLVSRFLDRLNIIQISSARAKRISHEATNSEKDWRSALLSRVRELCTIRTRQTFAECCLPSRCPSDFIDSFLIDLDTSVK